jgi:hypothetical protein
MLSDRALTGRRADSVVVGDVAGDCEAVSHILAGCYERVACITGSLSITTGCQRRAGYVKALEDTRRAVDESSRLSPSLSAVPSPLTTEARRAPGCCSTGSRATPARRAWSLFHPRSRSGKARHQNDAQLPGAAEGAVGTDQGTPDKEARNVEEH